MQAWVAGEQLMDLNVYASCAKQGDDAETSKDTGGRSNSSFP